VTIQHESLPGVHKGLIHVGGLRSNCILRSLIVFRDAGETHGLAESVARVSKHSRESIYPESLLQGCLSLGSDSAI
jgi:hypothetical protein